MPGKKKIFISACTIGIIMVTISKDMRDLSPQERIKRLRDLEESKKKELIALEKKKKEEVKDAEEQIRKTIEELTKEEEEKFKEQEAVLRKKEEEKSAPSIEEMVEEHRGKSSQQIQYGSPIEALKQEYNQTKELYERVTREGFTDNNLESFYKLKEQIQESGQDQYSRQKDTTNYITRSEDVLKILEKRMRMR